MGEPVHYVLAAIEKAHGGDEERILSEVTRNPENRLRYAVGNGASQPDIDKFMRWMGLEEMFELYGSTEAAISTYRRKQDPRGSVGEITDESVKILNERGDAFEKIAFLKMLIGGPRNLDTALNAMRFHAGSDIDGVPPQVIYELLLADDPGHDLA